MLIDSTAEEVPIVDHVEPSGLGKIAALEGLRGLACVAVFFAHFVGAFFPFIPAMFYPPQGITPHVWIETVFQIFPLNVFFNGQLAVAIFFVLSGYVLTIAWERSADQRAMQIAALKRYPRLVIPTAVSMLGAWVLLKAGMMQNQHAADVGAAGWVLDAYNMGVPHVYDAVLAAVFGGPVAENIYLNIPIWTIAIELFGSIALFAFLPLFRNKLVFAFWMLAVGFGLHQPVYIVAFLAGYLIHQWKGYIGARPGIAIGIGIAGLVIGDYNFSIFYEPLRWIPIPSVPVNLISLDDNAVRAFNLAALRFQADTLLRAEIFQVIGATMLVLGIVSSDVLSRILTSRYLSYLGRLSFSLYLLHWPIICSLSFWLVAATLAATSGNYVESVLVSLAITIAVWLVGSHYYYRFVDAPATKWSNRFAKETISGALRFPRLRMP